MICRSLLLAMLLPAAVHADSLRLVAPGDGAVLRGGHFATISWTADKLGKDAEEWEAFASVNGGRYYSVRLTPHLNISVRTFEFVVPNVDSDDVRILIRTGNERRESTLELPQRLRIRAEAISVAASPTSARGPESARPDEPPVVAWSVGDHVETAATPPQIVSSRLDSNHSNAITLVSRALCVVADFSRPDRLKPVPQISFRPPTAHSDILLQSSRLNV